MTSFELDADYPPPERLHALLSEQAQDIEWQELDFFWTLKYRLR